MHALCHALVLAHQPHDNTYGLAATPDGQTVFVDSRHCIYRSQDAGDSWQKANGAGSVRKELRRRSKSAYPLKVEVSTSAV